MRYLGSFIICVLILLSLQLPVLSQDLRISGDFQGSNLKEVLHQIESSYPLQFFYKEHWLYSMEIDQRFDQQSITNVLDALLENSDLSYLIYDQDKIIIGKKNRIEDQAAEEYFLARQSMEATDFDSRFPLLTLGRLSSVLDVQLKGNNYSATTLNGGIGTVMSKLAIETPVVKEKVSLLAGGRDLGVR